MKRKEEETSLYVQVISRFFLEQRGSPFFLASHEVEKIREWKNMGVPLQTVLEGIKDCFEAVRKKRGRKGRHYSLSGCHAFVLHSYRAYNERRVGLKRRPVRKEAEREKLKTAVECFLVSCPDHLSEIRDVYSRLVERPLKEVDEQTLEDWEQEVEAHILGMASDAERGKIRREVLAEFGDKSVREQNRIIELKLIKNTRQKYAIPHIPLYYY
jgi:hypothetical protein